ncbi:hypothetical protein FQN54_003065 [Arachnomyces sp. PD_36]|nr:hypothetical protein FQN54_003065 [Arachnomyces sp. PD_36]
MAVQGPPPPPKTFVLCFDGTGNKFSGTESDSNILKIYRMLDRNEGNQFHYYQPGIGTYVTSGSLSSSGTFSRLKSWYLKSKDSAIGSSFDQHVMGGYKFLMRYYSPGDEIYFFGFSRGAYIARFLSEMLDYVGLLTAGNEELVRFAWKTFSKWQQRSNSGDDYEKEKKELYEYMKAFRETFSRPVTRLRFLGLFDTVNSVPRFESAWMQRSKFPYTARSSAKVIRHAVGIDERRAKFRQDLISEVKRTHEPGHKHWPLHHHRHRHDQTNGTKETNGTNGTEQRTGAENNETNGDSHDKEDQQHPSFRARASWRLRGRHEEARYRPTPAHRPNRSQGPHIRVRSASAEDVTSIRSCSSAGSLQEQSGAMSTGSEDETAQDIQEVWFPGCHADIGGGWGLTDGESFALSHNPLVWMVQEAQRAGLQFDQLKLKQFACSEEFSLPSLHEGGHAIHGLRSHIPHTMSSLDEKAKESPSSHFRHALEIASTRGHIHDSLKSGGPITRLSAFSWNVMEYLPFRRMDLQPDGSWKPIRWPLPCGEVRDIPHDAQIHRSAILRLHADENYRPGNLIVGGGGRGVRKAPEHAGIGEWEVHQNEGDDVRETFVRSTKSQKEED